MTVNQFIQIFRARWRLGLAILLVVIAGVMAVTFLLPEKYSSTAAVVIDVKSPDPLQGTVNMALSSPAYMATQIDVLNSDQVARRVVRMTRLNESPQLQDQWRESTGGRGSFEDWISKFIREDLSVRPSRESNVITVSYVSQDPRMAAAMANAFVRAYIDVSREMRLEPARQYVGFFEERVATARQELQKAQAKLSAYQQEKGLIADDRFDAESARLAELTAQLVSIQSLAADSTSRQALAARHSNELQDVLNNPVVSTLRTDLSRMQAKLGEMEQRLGERHPEVLQARANIADTQRKIDEETRRVTGAVRVTNSINRAREADIKAAHEAQHAKVAELKRQRDAGAALVRDVENAQRAYDALLARLTQTNLESQNQQTNVAVLSEAVEQGSPSSPRPLLNLAFSILVGGLLAVAATVARELADRKIRSATDIIDGLSLPMLGAMPQAGARWKERIPLLFGKQGALPSPALGR